MSQSIGNCPPAVNSAEFRAVMSQFVTGVTVVTVSDADGPHGTTVNAFTSLSLDPPMVLVCLRSGGRGARALQCADYFGVSILGQEQLHVGRLFAAGGRPSGDAAFAGVPHRTGITGVPLLNGSVAHIECQVAQRIVAGDHVIFLGRVLDVAAGAAGEPLAFHRGQFRSVA